MGTWKIELRAAPVAFVNDGLVELQVEAFVVPALTERGKTPTSWLVMTEATARVLHGQLGDLLNR